MSDDRIDPQHGRGVLKDVHALHFPHDARAAPAAFGLGVGREGYDRQAGVQVPRHPSLWLPGEKAPRAAPFGAHADEETDATEEAAQAGGPQGHGPDDDDERRDPSGRKPDGGITWVD